MSEFVAGHKRYTVKGSIEGDLAVVAGPRRGTNFATVVPDSLGTVWALRSVRSSNKASAWLARQGDTFRELSGEEPLLRMRIARLRPDLAILVASYDVAGQLARAAAVLEVVEAAGGPTQAPPADRVARVVEMLDQ